MAISLWADTVVAAAAVGSPGPMSEPTTDRRETRHEDSAQHGEASPGATSPATHEDAEQADRQGRDVADDVEDNADLDG